MRTARVYRVQGLVQGVGFRWFVERVADELDVSGYVKNLYDGSVEVYAIGSEQQLQAMRLRLERGPRGARVTRVEEAPAALRDCHGFRIEF